LTAKEYLSQIRVIDEAIKSKSKQLKSLADSLLLIQSQDISSERVQTSAKLDASFTKNVETITELESQIIELNAQMSKIIDKIYSLDDLLQIKVLCKHYVDGKNLRRVSDELEYSYEWVRKAHLKALGNIEQIL
jgi:hypothetical protein